LRPIISYKKTFCKPLIRIDIRPMKNRIPKLIFLIFTAWISVRMGISVYETWKKQDILKERQKELANIENENKRLKRELEDVQSPDFIDKEARNSLGLVKPGEVIVLMSTPVPTRPPTETSDTGKPDPDSAGSAWKKWWQLFY
jgi:cell division protein FtsB